MTIYCVAACVGCSTKKNQGRNHMGLTELHKMAGTTFINAFQKPMGFFNPVNEQADRTGRLYGWSEPTDSTLRKLWKAKTDEFVFHANIPDRLADRKGISSSASSLFDSPRVRFLVADSYKLTSRTTLRERPGWDRWFHDGPYKEENLTNPKI